MSHKWKIEINKEEKENWRSNKCSVCLVAIASQEQGFYWSSVAVCYTLGSISIGFIHYCWLLINYETTK